MSAAEAEEERRRVRRTIQRAETGVMLQVKEGGRKEKKVRVEANLSESERRLSDRSPDHFLSFFFFFCLFFFFFFFHPPGAPPVSVNPLVKKQMFHHRGTSTRGCLTRRMECLLLLLGRQQTAGWESGQEERRQEKPV